MQDVKTYAGAVGATSKSKSRCAVFLKIAMLELERERRSRERLTATTRAQRIEARMQEIETEVAALHALTDGGAPRREPAGTKTETVGRRRVIRF